MFITNKESADLRIFSFIKCSLLLILCISILYGCSLTTVATPPPSSMGFYSDTLTPQINEGNFRFSDSKTFPGFTFDEVFDSAHKAALLRGLSIEKMDRDKGVMTGNGYLERIIADYGPVRASHTFAFYVEEISDEPQTKLTILVDTFSVDGKGWNQTKQSVYTYRGEKFTEILFAETLKILATIR